MKRLEPSIHILHRGFCEVDTVLDLSAFEVMDANSIVQEIPG